MSSKKFPISQEREGEWTSPSTFLIQGVPILQFFTPDPAVLYSYIVNFETRAEDVFVVSYPKSGMQNYSFRKETSPISFSKGKAVEADEVAEEVGKKSGKWGEAGGGATPLNVGGVWQGLDQGRFSKSKIDPLCIARVMAFSAASLFLERFNNDNNNNNT